MNSRLIAAIFVLILACLLFLSKLGNHPIIRWDEQTNIKVAENYSLTEPTQLTLDNKPFLEKPPLWYMLTGTLAQATGNYLFSYRLLSALAGIGTTMFIFYLLKIKYSLTAAILGSLSFLAISQNIVPNSFENFFSSHTFRTADLDSLQILFIIVGFVLFELSIKESKKWVWYLCCFCLGLAFLTKGPYALFILGMLLAAKYLRTSQKDIKTLVIGLVIFLITIIPWHIYMYLTFGQVFLSEYFHYHIVNRTFSTLEDHSEGPFFYLKVLLSPYVNIIWPLFLLPLWKLIRKQLDDFELMHLSIVLLTLVMISLMQTKLAWYLLPLYPSFCIILGSSIAKANKFIQIAAAALIAAGITANFLYIYYL